MASEQKINFSRRSAALIFFLTFSEKISNYQTLLKIKGFSPRRITVFSVKPLFKRFQRFEKSLYGLKRPIFESEFVLASLREIIKNNLTVVIK